MKLPIFVLLSVLASIAGAWEIEDGGEINNFIWPQDSKDLPKFSLQQKVLFESSYFENFTHAIGDQLENVKELVFYLGTVLQVQLKKNIEKLAIHHSKTKNVEIDPNDEYAIVVLMVYHCELSSIPKYTNRLRRLKTLYLRYSKIEHVQMTDFNGLNNLETLLLNDNGMKTLSSESTIHLPKLSRLDLDNNNLREINVCSWDMPALATFHLLRNKLKFIVNLVDQFPKLSTISISNNPLVCQWKDNLDRSLKSKNISLWSATTCNATDETHVPIECPLVYSLSNQLSGLLERQRSSEQSMGNSTKKIESLEQMMEKSIEESKAFRQSMETFKQHSLEKQNALEKTVETLTDQLQKMAKNSNEENQSLNQTITKLTDQHQRMEKKSTEEIQSLSDQLTKLRHSIDDLTEGFYRYVLEKEGGEK